METNTAVETVATETPRKLAGLVAGRIVNYVMTDGSIRPLIITNALDGTGKINGVLVFDGSGDSLLHPVPLLPGVSGFPPTTTRWIGPIEYCESAESVWTVGTWHWPARPQVIASGLDAAVTKVLQEAIEAEVEEKFQGLFATLNEKVKQAVDSVNGLVESHQRTLQALAEEAAKVPAANPEPSPVPETQLPGSSTGENIATEATSEPAAIEPEAAPEMKPIEESPESIS